MSSLIALLVAGCFWAILTKVLVLQLNMVGEVIGC